MLVDIIRSGHAYQNDKIDNKWDPDNQQQEGGQRPLGNHLSRLLSPFESRGMGMDRDVEGVVLGTQVEEDNHCRCFQCHAKLRHHGIYRSVMDSQTEFFRWTFAGQLK